MLTLFVGNTAFCTYWKPLLIAVLCLPFIIFFCFCWTHSPELSHKSKMCMFWLTTRKWSLCLDLCQAHIIESVHDIMHINEALKHLLLLECVWWRRAIGNRDRGLKWEFIILNGQILYNAYSDHPAQRMINIKFKYWVNVKKFKHLAGLIEKFKHLAGLIV